MKKTLIAATSLLALVAFGAHASDEHAKTEAVKAPAATEAVKAEEATKGTEAPAAGTEKKDEKAEHEGKEHTKEAK